MSDTTSRRGLLTQFGLIAGAAGVVGAGGVLVRDASRSSGREGGLPKVLNGTNWRLVRQGVPRGTLAPPGTRALPIGTLVDEDGLYAGAFDASDLATSGPGTHVHRLNLNEGMIMGIGPDTLPEATFTVVGGTGRYAGASGTYLARQRPSGHGGSAEFILDITTPEA